MRSALASLVIAVSSSACSFPKPADVPNDDASTNDAPSELDAPLVDARPLDASPPDAMPPPPVVTGQAADLVLGQPDFSSSTENNGGLSARSLAHPEDVWTDGISLWVADLANRRVLQWNALPAVNFAAADVVLGQPNEQTNATNNIDAQKINGGDLAALALSAKTSGATVGAHVMISDPGFSRVIIWNPHPATSGVNAAQVLGYPTFATGSTASPTATNLNTPSGVWSDGSKLAVADTQNHRVLLWTTFPTNNGQAANLVLGQTSFTTNATGTTSVLMNKPMAVCYDGTRLYVADSGNNRVMVWNTWPTQNGKAADFIIGQTNATSSMTDAGGAGPNDVGLDRPSDLLVANGALFIVDNANNRVIVHYPIPTASGTKATAVLGQSVFNSAAAGTGAGGMYVPMGIGAGGGYLFVAENGNHRVLRFTLSH